MTKKSLFLGLVLALACLSARAQITEVYRQGFESGQTSSHYHVVSGQASVQSTYRNSGGNALRMDFSSQEVIVEFDTIDFSTNNSWGFWEMEFWHINNIDNTHTASATETCVLEYRRIDLPNWTTMTGNTDYLRGDDGFSAFYASASSFCREAYSDWAYATSLGGMVWRRERFTMQVPMTNAAVGQRKFIVRMVVRPNVGATVQNQAWIVDDIVFRASSQSMTSPRVTMLQYPDLMNYPSSRSMYLKMSATTPVTEGIDLDSCYVVAKLGASPSQPEIRIPMELVSSNGGSNVPHTNVVMQARVPFVGFDTLISYRVVCRDATLNRNTTYYPTGGTNFAQYRHVRGHTNQASIAQSNGLPVSNLTNLPFHESSTSRSQTLYTRDQMQAAGYEPGAITAFTIPVRAAVTNSEHSRLEIRMANVASDFTVSLAAGALSVAFQPSGMATVYDSALTITQNANTTLRINLQDTFYYAGEGVLMQYIYWNKNANGNWVNTRGVTVAGFNNDANHRAIYNFAESQNQFNPWTSGTFFSGDVSSKTPDVSFVAQVHPPLVFDCGISGFVSPNDTISADATGTNTVEVTLTNYGVNPISQVPIYLSIDNLPADSIVWTGNLAGGASTNVVLTTTQTFSVGYHEMRAWVGDTVTSLGTRQRDHEPLNDTCWTRMVSCAGPMSGQRTVGGVNADYQTLEKFLYSASICGVNGPLHVKLAAGQYAPTVFPAIPGASMQNYVQFEPAGTGNGQVTFTTGRVLNNTPLLDLRGSRYLRFNNIAVATSSVNRATYPVRLGITSVGCQFLNCQFIENINILQPTLTYANALIYSGGADSITVDNCTFSRGTIGISMVGPAADNLASGAVITRNYFENQGDNSIVLRNHISSVVDSNTMMDLISSSGYLLLVQQCHQNVRVTRNTAYITSGSACLGVSELIGTPASNAVIANNMLICDDNGEADIMTTPMFIIGAKHTKILHNSVRMFAPTRAGIAAATFGGNEVDQCYFYNNIIVSMDTANYAFSYVPWPGMSNYIGYNIYYSNSYLLNKYDGMGCTNLNTWNMHINDGHSQNVNPAFLLRTPTDLRSYSQQVKHHAMPFPEVTDDIFGTTRDSVSPCVGAFEFTFVPYDFEIISVEQPLPEYCDVPAYGAPLRVWIKNSGINTYHWGPGSTLTITHSRTPNPGVMVPGLSGNLEVHDSIPGNSTVLCSLGTPNLLFPTNGNRDTTYTFSLWLNSTLDPNPTNDTSQFTVTARNHEPAVTPVNINSPYGQSATINVTQGVQSWYTNVYTSGRMEKSTVFWYHDSTETEPFYQGPTLVTNRLYDDTTFVVRQKRNMPLIRITEVQFRNAGEGITFPLPMWMNPSTYFAVELTNIGDAPANLLGDTLMTIAANANGSAQSSYNNKYYIFPDVTVQPGQTMVVQWKSNSAACDTAHTLYGTNLNAPTYNLNWAVLYRDKKGVADAVAFNNINTVSGTIWSSQNIHNTVWSGTAIAVPDNTFVGVVRTSFPTTTGSPTPTANQWVLASSDHPMNLGTTTNSLIRYRDNGCPGEPAPVNITLISRPTVDLMVTNIEVAEGCDLGMEPVSVTIDNHGTTPSGLVCVRYSVNGILQCTDTIADILNGNTVVHTFSQPADLTVSSGTQHFNLVAWVDHLATDNVTHNDTTTATTYSSFTPFAPVVRTYDTVDYASRATLTTLTPTADTLHWYDRNMNELAYTNSYTTSFLYDDDTFFVAGVAPMPTNVHIGTLASTNAVNNYPSPLNPKQLYGQEQYIFTAQELIAAGHTAGTITSLAFYLENIAGTTGSMSFTSYNISLGTTTATSFSANNDWYTNLTPVYNGTNLTFTNGQHGQSWVRFDFDQPFVWDGQSNIVVAIRRADNGTHASGAQTRYTTTSVSNTVLYLDNSVANTLNMPPTTNNNAAANGTRKAERPDIQFTFLDYGCEGPTSPIYIHVINVPPTDAALEWPGDPAGGYTSCGPIDFDVVVRNGGNDTIHSYTIDYQVDNVTGTFTGTAPISPRSTVTMTIATPTLDPGRHFLKAIVSAANDTIPVNDTIQRVINVQFCAGNYTLGTSAGNDYPSFDVALDTLYAAGVAGAVVFAVESGTYSGQITVGSIPGTDFDNTVTFQAASGNPDDVIITAPTTSMTASANYVLNVNGAGYVRFRNLTISAQGPTASSAAVQLTNATNVRFIGSIIRIVTTSSNANSTCFLLNNNVRGFYLDSCQVVNGYYSVKSTVTEPNQCEGIYLTENTFSNFYSEGIYLSKVGDVFLRHNQILSSANTARNLTGVDAIDVYNSLKIERNNIVLFDDKSGVKTPIKVDNYIGNNTDRGFICNNMCVAHGTGGASKGITIKNCEYINVYFNSVRVWAGVTSNNTRALSVEENSGTIFVINNIFANFSQGYAYWINNAQNVATSNYNVFFSDTTIATKRLAHVGTSELDNLDTLRFVTGKEANSRFDQTYFEAPNDLHLAYGLYNEKALYLPDVVNDIDGEARPAIPAPCIGADEFPRQIHDVAIMQFMTPTLGSTTIFSQENANAPWTFKHTANNPVEADTLWVVVKLFNNGSSTETDLWWNAQIADSVNLVSPTRTIDEMQPGEIIYDTTFIVMPMGCIDTQHVIAYFSTDMASDAAPGNNISDTVFCIDMAYDFCMTGGNDDIWIDTDPAGYGNGCRMYETPVHIRLTNKGKKAIPVDYPITIGYEVKLPSTANYTIQQIPLVHEEQIYLAVPLDTNVSIEVSFVQTANLYPTGNSLDADLRLRGWVSYQFDQKPVDVRSNVFQSRDTTASFIRTGTSGNAANPQNAWKAIKSKYTPRAPEGQDLTVHYATWDTLRATQGEVLPGNNGHLPIKWWRDSTDTDPFHAPAQYARSTWWETPQYYHDSVYFLSCVSAGTANYNPDGCVSDYSAIHVHVAPRVTTDVAIMGEDFRNPDDPAYNPVASPADKVYMTQCPDTVKVHVVNYGSQTATNFPVTYRYYTKANANSNSRTLLAEVTETCHASIPPDSIYLFKFDSLITIPAENPWYEISCFTAHPNDMVRGNDTMRTRFVFHPKPETSYWVQDGNPTTSVDNQRSLDITHVSFSSLWNDVPEVGRLYTDFARINNPEVPLLYLIKGTTDTMEVSVANAGDHADNTTIGTLSVWIDYNRDGGYHDSVYTIYDNTDYNELLFSDTIRSRQSIRFPITIPDYAPLGYTRMRVMIQEGMDSVRPDFVIASGNIQDYLLYIEDVPVETDLAVCGVEYPSGFEVYPGDSLAVRFKMSNKGSSPITEADIHYQIVHTNRYTNNFTWTGLLEPGHSTTVELPAYNIDFGRYTYKIWADVLGDTIKDNDTIRAQFFSFDTINLVMDEDFERNRYHWYAPTGFTAWNRNVWQQGHSNKPHLNVCVSDSNLLATNLNGVLNAAHRGALCYYYTPIIDIMQVRPDTISFWMAFNLADSNEFYIEYLDWERKWRVLGDGNDTNWYNSRYSVQGTSPGYSYVYYELPTNRLSTDFFPRLQFRLVYHAEPGALACEGVAIDNFKIGRARRSVDVGVTDIVYPTNPRFGEIIRPIVEITNFGYDTIYHTNLAYRPYGSILPKTATCDTPIPPGGTTNFQFPDPFVIMADFPDTFDICAFTTVNMDIYWENDSTCKDFYLTPLDNDMGMVSFVSPTDRVVAGDSLVITTRIRNYGQAPVSNARVTYRYNTLQVTENIDFEAILGRPLNSFEYFNYSFRQKCRATMGMMNFKAWVDYDGDDYIYNDTITQTSMGISAIVDLRARSVVFDTANDKGFRVQLMVENVGALGVSDFDVYFWYDRDPSTLLTKSMHLDQPLPALSSTTVVFDSVIPKRFWPNGYFYVTGIVTAANDNDRTNDTTTVIETQYLDFVARRILVEEDMWDECRVRFELANEGNLIYDRSNGIRTELRVNDVVVYNDALCIVLEPGQVMQVDFERKIPRSPSRNYYGMANINYSNDINLANNQTTLVEVQNHFGVPTVEGSDGITLDQNYPNPFSAETSIAFHIPTAGTVRFFVMDAMGRLVYQSEDNYEAGDNSILFSQTTLSTGAYYYGIEMGDTRLMRKMVFMK